MKMQHMKQHFSSHYENKMTGRTSTLTLALVYLTISRPINPDEECLVRSREVNSGIHQNQGIVLFLNVDPSFQLTKLICK